MPTTSRFHLDKRWAKLRKQVAMERRSCWICQDAIDYHAKQGSPLSYHLDHIVPVDRGGESIYENVEATHACCNVWRGNRSVAEVNATKAAIIAAYGGWSSPEDFVRKAKSLKRGKPVAPSVRPRLTTDW